MATANDPNGMLRLLGGANEEFKPSDMEMNPGVFTIGQDSEFYIDCGGKGRNERAGILKSYTLERDHDTIVAPTTSGDFSSHQGRGRSAVKVTLTKPNGSLLRKLLLARKAVNIYMIIGGNPAWGSVLIKEISGVTYGGDDASIDVTMEVIGKIHMADPKEPDRALAYARVAHAGQKRRYDGRDYIAHPMSVAHIVQVFGGSHNMISAAFLHDVVEDTDKTQQDIEREFSPKVAELVRWLTDVPLEDGNRARRKLLDRERLSLAPAEAKTIKMADIICNAPSIKANDPKFWPVFRSECVALLDALRGGNEKLWEITHNLLTEE